MCEIRGLPITTCRHEGVGNVIDAIGPGSPARFRSRRDRLRARRIRRAGLESTQGFLHDSWKVRPIAITSPDRFHLRGEPVVCCGNFSNANRGSFVTT